MSATGTSVSHDFEPAIRVGPDSTVYTATNYHNTATGLAAVAYGDASDATNRYQIVVARQTAGPGL